jgi:hypothetical protein
MAESSPDQPSAASRLVYGKDDVLFGSIEEAQQDRPFGSILDAGTGLHSLRWIATLADKGMTSFTAITADETMQRTVQRETEALGVDPSVGEVLIGNWFDVDGKLAQAPLQLKGQLFDTVLLDYLIGAVDGFSPYKQDQMISKLTQFLKPGGRLYIVSLQPIPDKAPGDANIICRVRQVRDACILLAGHRCYREYPVDWVERQVEGLSDLQLVGSRRFPILYRHSTIVKQIQVGRSKLKLFDSPTLAESMGQVLDDLQQKSLEATQRAPHGKIQLGFDYLVTVEKVIQENKHSLEDA